MIHKTKFFAALALVGVVASIASAGQVAVIPTVSARFDNATNFNPLPFTSPGAGPITDGPGLYQIDLSIHTTNLAANERGFASLAFDVVFGAGQSVGFDYAPDPSQVDSNGTLPGGLVAKWTTNTDAGVPGDYQGILLAGPGALSATCGGSNCPDPRGRLGDPNPEFFGSLFVNVTGSSSLGFGNYQFSLRDLDSGQFNTPQDGTIVPVVFNFNGGGGEENPPVVTDFADTADLNETIAALLQATNGPNTWSFVSPDPVYTPGFGADPGAPGAFFDATLGTNGQFSFNTQGATRGTYVWTVQAMNADGSDTGLVTITVPNIPEPASFALAGLAMIGVIGTLRRRS